MTQTRHLDFLDDLDDLHGIGSIRDHALGNNSLRRSICSIDVHGAFVRMIHGCRGSSASHRVHENDFLFHRPKDFVRNAAAALSSTGHMECLRTLPLCALDRGPVQFRPILGARGAFLMIISWSALASAEQNRR